MRRTGTRGSRSRDPGRALVGALAVAAMLLVPDTADAQRRGVERGVRLTAFAAGSLRESPAGFGVFRDVRSASLRVTLRRTGAHPWVEGGVFVRPDLSCPDGVVCNTDGWTARGGVVLPFSLNDRGPGAHPYLIIGAGAAVSEQTKFSYLIGFGVAAAVNAWLAPTAEFRWEDLPGIRNVLMANLGIRIDAF